MTRSDARDRIRALGLPAGVLLAAAAWAAKGTPAASPALSESEPASVPALAPPTPEGKTNALDRAHEWIYHAADQGVTRFDSWFAPPDGPARDIPPSRFRLGLFGECRWEPDESVALEPVVEFDAKVKLPHIEERLHLFLTTLDPTDLPGAEALRERVTPRLGLARRWLESIDTSAGAKLQWPPIAYAKVAWCPRWYPGEWTIAPRQKAYWESDDGIGEVTSLVIDRWLGRWNLRSASSLKWSEKRAKDDEDEGIEPRGWQWAQVLLAGYAQELLNEGETSRVASGEDLARGGGVRVTLQGRPACGERIRVTPFGKWPLYRRWLYGWVEPEILWDRETGWAPGYGLTIGVEALFGDDEDR